MLTRCPACAATFRVTAEQIKLRAGRVRCGECRQAFNALDTLVDEFVTLPAEMPGTVDGPAPGPDAVPASMPAAAESAAPQGDFPETDSKLRGVSPAPTFPALEEEPPLAASTGEITSTTDEIGGEPGDDGEKAEATTNILLDQIPEWSDGPNVTTTSRRWPWLLGSLLLLVTLGIQAAIALRVELAMLAPAARPALVSLCSITGCKVDLPAKAELIGIEASDLHPDPAQPGRLVVSATLKNRAPFNQQFPHLELTLTDVADKAIARKVLTPTDYLPPETPRAKGMRPNADIAVNLIIDIGQLTANGYRLYLFYP